ncbi:uncharacterized protein LOC128236152 [Mya arenaria]|uniref:uncharacterized protein LOC128236152 n=1 Tax=Mya arenaria TaxID=6604 RepID=UPI0022E1123C|nr:uncharacterized protein LOC128236152 [Mya arenaria]XP_052806984.1 uncharacterized protein LOC128236152 [Mya arenaria]XP_052806986.1 uncharacterized protein LOC128236152 [Mya arenaria]
MRLRDVNLTSVVLRTFLFLQTLPIVLSCIYLLNGWKPMPIFNRTASADVVISGHVIKTYKEQQYRTDAMTFTATVKLFDVYKGKRLLRNIPTLDDSQHVYNVTNFGDRKMCYADVMEGRNYILFLTTYKQRLSAKYDDIFGAATKYTESNVDEVKAQVGLDVADWTEWGACSRSCDGGRQARKRNCTAPSGDCDDLDMEKRACNTFNCDLLHDLLSHLGVYKLPLGVYHVHQRPGAFNVTRRARLYTPFSDIFPNNLPQEFSLLASIRVGQNFSGYLLTLSDSQGVQIFGLKFTQNDTESVISITVLNTSTSQSYNVLSLAFTSISEDLQQFAIGFTPERIQVHYDCDKIYTKQIKNIDPSVWFRGLMMSIGPYSEEAEGQFEGSIEQLALIEDPRAAEQQCSEQYDDSDRAIKDEENNEIDDFRGPRTENTDDKTVQETKQPHGIANSSTTLAPSPQGQWTEWSECSRTCGRGVQVRSLYCGDNVLSACALAGRDSEQGRWCFLRPCAVECRPQCQNGGRCLHSGSCFCPSGFTGSACEHDMCGVQCENGGWCVGPGLCQCPPGFTGNQCETAVCDPPCGPRGHCLRPGFCSCPYGYMPPNCDPICLLPCMNGGKCVGHNTCQCPRGYVGQDCSIPICRRGCYNGGRCVAPNKCACASGFVGSRCQKAVCDPACQNKGRCLYPDVCQCKRGFSGLFCETAVCRKSCKNGGVCAGGNRCTCQEGFRGRWCHKPIRSSKCRHVCQNGGRCRKNKCKCTPAFHGERCEKRKCHYQSYLIPYVDTYPKLERFDVVTSCKLWPWATCVETRMQYVLTPRTLYRSEYRCL